MKPKTELAEYTTNKAAIAKMSDIYLKLTIDGIEDTEGFDAVHSAKMVMVKHRIGIDKLRKKTNENARNFIKTNDTNAKKLLDLMEPIETHLKNEEAKITKEKERIREEEEKLEKIKINDRVSALFDVSVNIPYFEASMMSDEEYETMLDEATNKHNAKRLRLQEEQRMKEEAEAKLEADRAEIARIKKKQEAKAKEQADKEAALEEQAKLIEDEKKAESERKKREEFKRQAKEDARIHAEKDAKEKAEKERREQRKKTEESRTKLLFAVDFSGIKHDLGTMPNDQFDRMYGETKAKWDTKQAKLIAEKLEKEREEFEKTRIANEKVDREAKELETKTARFESLKKLGFEYPFNDLGIMPNKQYVELYDKHWTIWDKKRQALLAEKLEKERVEKEKAEAAEKKRLELLLPDKDKLTRYAASILKLDAPDIKNRKVQKILTKAQDSLGQIAQDISQQVKEL